jgi:TM2 domain-containing membrane protein YozV
MRLLSQCRHEPTRRHRAVLTADLSLDLGMGYRGTHHFYHEQTLWGVLVDDHLHILAGYASDLCSPGFYLFGRWWGTPSKGAELASILHDFARQFMRPAVACSPWDRKGSDDLFYNALCLSNHPLASTYHGAVAGRLGDLWLRLNRPRPAVSCKRCQPCNLELCCEPGTP